MRVVCRVALAVAAALMVLLLPSSAWAEDNDGVLQTTSPDYEIGKNWPTSSSYDWARQRQALRISVYLGNPWPSPEPVWGMVWRCEGTGDTIHSNYGLSYFQNSDVFGRAGWTSWWIDTTYGCDAGKGAPASLALYRHASGDTKDQALTQANLVAQWTSTGAWIVAPEETASTCDSFRNVEVSVGEGLADLSWRWKGTVPARGWRITDAASTADAGAGATLVDVPAVESPAGSGRYGLAAWTVPAGVAHLRVVSRSDSGCFIGFDVERDAAGVVTGIVAAGGTETPVDTTRPEPATDEDGVSCGMFDIPCVLKYLFVPDSDSWNLTALRSQVETRPPFSLAVSIGAGVKAASETFRDGGWCLGWLPKTPGMAGNSEVGNNTPIGCHEWRESEVGGWAFLLMNTLLVITTAMILWDMARDAFSGGGD